MTTEYLIIILQTKLQNYKKMTFLTIKERFSEEICYICIVMGNMLTA